MFPFPSNLSLAFCFLSLAPPTTFALPVEAIPPFVYSFFRAPTPFSCLKIVIISIVTVFPSLKPKLENNDPYAKFTTPYYVTLLFEENF